MLHVSPDAFFLAYKNKKATFECLKSFRRFNPHSYILLGSDAGDDLADIGRLFDCDYRRFDRVGRPPWDANAMQEWLRRFTLAAHRGRSDYIMLLEDDVLIRGQIHLDRPIAIAGPMHRKARLSNRLIDYVRTMNSSLASDHYGGCGGTIFHRETLLETAALLTSQTSQRCES